jgi:hypothetical protein
MYAAKNNAYRWHDYEQYVQQTQHYFTGVTIYLKKPDGA